MIQQINTKNKFVYLPLVIIFIALFLYVFLRANSVSFTHDEGISYKIVKGDHGWARTANNHVLNTFLMSRCSALFGDTELSLRLPNVLSFLVYLIFSFYILKESKSVFFIYFGAFLLLLNHFSIDFFSLARGYGLSLSFLLPALYFLFKKKQQSYKDFLVDFILAMMFCSLSLFSNLSVVNFYIAILSIFVMQYLLLAKKNKLVTKQHGIFFLVLILTCIPLIIGVQNLLALSKRNELFFGEKTLVGTVSSLINCSFSERFIWVNEVIKCFVISSFFTGVIISIFSRDFYNNVFKMTLVIGFVSLGLIIEHYFFKSNYPPDRTAVVFIPAFGLFLYYLLEFFYQKINSKMKNIYLVFLFVFLMLPGTILFASKMNLTYTNMWKFDNHTKEVMEIINNQSKNYPRKILVSSPWYFEPEMNFYIETKKMNIEPATRNPINLNADFIYESTGTVFDAKDYDLIKKYDDIGAVLYKKKNTVLK